MSTTDEDMQQAFDRIARTEDGRLIYLYFQKRLCAVTSEAAPECALPRNEGRRSFAAEVMDLMAKGIEESVGRDSNGHAVIFARRQPSGGHKHVTAREYIRANADLDPTDGRSS